MTKFVASAPGKLVIAGEYAVLEGAPAIATAVDRRAVAELETGAERYELCIANSGECFGFDLADKGLHWHDNPGDQGNLLIAAAEVFGSALTKLEPFSVSLCTREFYADGIKQGLGSSAALAVALSGCLQHALGQQSDIGTALAVHREFQHGSGSGIDVHTSFHGGTVTVIDNAAQRCDWPEGVFMLPVWTGVAASTPARLKALASFAADEPRIYTQQQAALGKFADKAVQACQSGHAEQVLISLQEFSGGLRDFDAATGLGIWSPEHVELHRMATQEQVIYKPSGAGGGDFGLAFSVDHAPLQLFRQTVESAGYACTGLRVGASGLRVN